MAKIETLDLQIVINCGNYESLRLGAQWTPDKGNDMQKEFEQMDAELRKQAYNILMARTKQQNPVKANAASGTVLPASDYDGTPKEESEQKREPLTTSDKRLQTIVNRMAKNPEKVDEIMSNTLKYFEPDADALNVLNAQIQLLK